MCVSESQLIAFLFIKVKKIVQVYFFQVITKHTITKLRQTQTTFFTVKIALEIIIMAVKFVLTLS